MKRAVLAAGILIVVAAAAVSNAEAQTATQSSYEFQMYQVVLLKHGPNWKPQHEAEGMDIRMNTIEAIKKGVQQGLVVTAGLVNDETDVEIIMIMNIETKTEALEIARKAPNLRNGFWTAEIYSWFAPKGLTVSPPRSMTPKEK
jgi:hypothetical protein